MPTTQDHVIAIPDTQDEAARQRALDAYHAVDSLAEAAYDDIVRVAAAVCNTPTALVTLIDRNRQWFKARLGFDEAQTPRNVAVCDHAIRTPGQLLEVPDLHADPRFATNPYVDGRLGAARFYAGAPLVTAEGAAIGTVCVVDEHPRALSGLQRDALAALARLTIALLDGRVRDRILAHESFIAAAAPAVGETSAPPPGYTLALVELQDHAGVVARLGERTTEKLLLQLEEVFGQCVDASSGDAINRSGGNVEYVIVLHGAGADATLARLREVAASEGRTHGIRLLVATAATAQGDESPHAVFLRAEEDLLDQKQSQDLAA